MIRQILERELSISEILSNSWNIYSKQFKSITIITLMIYVPINIILYLIGDNIVDIESLKNYNNVIKLLENLFGIIATMGIAVVVEKTILSENDIEASWGEAISTAFSRWGSCIGTNILGGLIILGLSMLLIIPGLIWALYYAFSVQVVVLKNIGGKEALDYSKSLVKGQWWKTFGTLFVLGIIGILIGIVIGIAIEFFSPYLPDSTSIITDTALDIFGAFFTVAFTVYFINIDFVRGNNTISENDNTYIDF